MADESREYGLIRPFDIDDGQLDGMELAEAFVLGYELSLVDQALDRGYGAMSPVHAANQHRIASECKRRNRKYRLTWVHNDVSEEWMSLSLCDVDTGEFPSLDDFDLDEEEIANRELEEELFVDFEEAVTQYPEVAIYEVFPLRMMDRVEQLCARGQRDYKIVPAHFDQDVFWVEVAPAGQGFPPVD